MFGNCSAGPMAQNRTVALRGDRKALTRKSPDFQGFFYALEWTRTTTPYTQDKALNLARLPIPPRAQSGRVYPAPGSGSACRLHPSTARATVRTHVRFRTQFIRHGSRAHMDLTKRQQEIFDFIGKYSA